MSRNLAKQTKFVASQADWIGRTVNAVAASLTPNNARARLPPINRANTLTTTAIKIVVSAVDRTIHARRLFSRLASNERCSPPPPHIANAL